MGKIKIKGIIPAMVTPLDNRKNINKTALRELTDFLIDKGVHGLFPIGSTGEWYGLSYDQKKEVITTVVEQAQGKVPVYAGTGSITTNKTIKLTQMAEKAGADAVSVLTPVFIKPNDEELYQHYKSIASSVEIPVLLYNNPGRTGIKLSVEVVKQLSKIENIVGIKDSSGDMTLVGEYIRKTDNDFNVLSGKDTLILSTLVYGGKGSITASANFIPKLAVEIYEEYVNGNLLKARQAQFKLAPLRMAFSLGTFPVVMKEALKLRGIDVGSTLLPVGPMEKEKRNKLKKMLKNAKVI